MAGNFTAEKIGFPRGDTLLLSLVIVLSGIGIGVLFSASHYYGEIRFNDPFFFLRRHAVHLLFGVFLGFLSYRIPLGIVKKYIPLLLLLGLVSVALTFIPGVGQSMLGANRWLIIGGISFQPSELLKVAVVLYLAHIFSKKKDRMDDIVNTILPPLVVVSLITALVYLQNDFSTAFFIFFIALAMFFIANIKLIYFIFLGTAVIPLGGILLFTKEHRVRRLIAFLDPGVDPVGAGYQINAARSALMNGGFWGAGLGEGTKKLGGLPEAHSDFVFAVLGEEMGLLGIVFVLALFGLLAYRGYKISLERKDLFGYYLGFGITTALIYQVLLNSAVVSGLVPATGITLPFFSSGGSSLVITLIMSGILLNLSRQSDIPGEEGSE